MTEPQITTLLTVVVAVLTATIPLMAAITAYLTHKTAVAVVAQGVTVARLEQNTNHLLELSNATAHAAGVTEGATGVPTPDIPQSPNAVTFKGVT